MNLVESVYWLELHGCKVLAGDHNFTYKVTDKAGNNHFKADVISTQLIAFAIGHRAAWQQRNNHLKQFNHDKGTTQATQARQSNAKA